MSLAKLLYSQDRGKTLAQSIDEAWVIYSDESKNEKDRLVAQGFLIYAFDIEERENLNLQLLELMEERNKYKEKNPEYIPRISPTRLKLKPSRMQLKPVPLSGEISDPKFQRVSKLLKKQELLDVNKIDKSTDQKDGTKFFSHTERAPYRVHIHKGKFYKSGELFDTSSYVAHKKDGYAAFTINANGELSVFNHFSGKDKVVHSSLNAGCPVIAAGELVINKGELIAINTYSGHYEPKLFHIYRALEFFKHKKINIGSTNVYLYCNPKHIFPEYKQGNVVAPTQKLGGDTFFIIPASVIYPAINHVLIEALNNLQVDIQKYKAHSIKKILYYIKDAIIHSKLTKKRKKIADLAQDLVRKQSEAEGQVLKLPDMEHFKSELEKLLKENQQLSVQHKKKPNSGRLQKLLEETIQQLENDIQKISLDEKHKEILQKYW